MQNRTVHITLAWVALSLLAAGCQGDARNGSPGARDTPSADSTQAGAVTAPADPARSMRAVLPGLFGIMANLETDMVRISHGIWSERYDIIVAGARSIEDHPTVPPDELSRVREALGEEIAQFRSLDTRVHDLAVRLAEEAGAGDMEAVMQTDAELRQGCVACHVRYRERLRTAIP